MYEMDNVIRDFEKCFFRKITPKNSFFNITMQHVENSHLGFMH